MVGEIDRESCEVGLSGEYLSGDEACLALKFYLYTATLGSIDSYAEGKAEEEDEPSGSLSLDISCREIIDTSDYESGSITPTTIGSSLPEPIDQSIFESEGWETFREYVQSKFADGEIVQSVNALIKTSEDEIEKYRLVIEESRKKIQEAAEDKYFDMLKQECNDPKKNKAKTDKMLNAKKRFCSLSAKYLWSDEFFIPLPDRVVFREYYQHNCEKAEAPLYGAPVVPRYGICSSEFKKLCGVATGGFLHPVEFVVLFNAIEHLKGRAAAHFWLPGIPSEYKDNVVLCDIFARESGTSPFERNTRVILTDGHSNPEIHTVALWKIADNKIVLIDPTKSAFSKFVVDALNPMFNGITIKPLVEVLQSSDSDSGAFYNKGGDTINVGRGTNDPRDCIDIAVKIGFELNELQKSSHDAGEIARRVYDKMANGANKGVEALKLLRDAHSSDMKIREQFFCAYKTLKEVRSQHPEVKKFMARLNPVDKTK